MLVLKLAESAVVVVFVVFWVEGLTTNNPAKLTAVTIARIPAIIFSLRLFFALFLAIVIRV